MTNRKSASNNKRKRKRKKKASSGPQAKRKGRRSSAESEIEAGQANSRVHHARDKQTERDGESPSWLRRVADALGNHTVLRLMSKARNREQGAAQKPASEPIRVLRKLDKGRALDGNVRQQMEAGLGENFGDVRIHTSEDAAKLAQEQNAIAFTVGQHIVFDHGEYQPGTLEGKALIAHELAHTIQQKDATADMTTAAAASEASLEEDAHRAVAGVAQHQFGSIQRALADFPTLIRPRLRSGLRVARCISKPKTPEEKFEAVKSTMSKAENGFKTAEILLDNPEASKKAAEVSDTLGKANKVIDTVDKGVKLYGLVEAFSELNKVDPSEDPEGFAEASGEALASAGEVMKMSKIPGISMYGEFLSNAGNFFVNMTYGLWPKRRPNIRDKEIKKYMP